MEQVDIKKMTTEQLKVLGYDTIAQMEQIQRNLQAINLEIQLRAEEKGEVQK